MIDRGWAEDFSYSYYLKILWLLKKYFQFSKLGEIDNLIGNHASIARVFIRHDIDVDPKFALHLALLEKNEGIFSCYMFIPNATLYDVKKPSNQKIIRQIAGMGHEIGLHYDEETWREDKGIFVKHLKKDIISKKQFLENITGVKVKSISFHRPLESWLRGPAKLFGMTNAYSKKLMENYISDSKGRWRCGDPLKIIKKSPNCYLQILTHPIWWGKAHIPAVNRLKSYYFSQTKSMKKDEKENFNKLIYDVTAISIL